MVTSWTPSTGQEQTLRVDELTLEDLEAVRLMLRGSSVVDWYQLHFRDESDVDRFLRVNEFDPASADDLERLEELRLDAVEYLGRNFNMELPDAVANRVPVRDLFLMASREGKQKTWACIILKVMHIVHHLAGRELSTRLPISVDQIYRKIELKVMHVIDELRAAGYPVVEFQWSRKTQDSLITKLLAKRSTLAANIYDKLRFRMVVRTQRDLVAMLVALHRRLIPFNYVVPGASVNHLLPFHRVLDERQDLRAMERLLQHDTMLEKRQERAASAPINEFSGKKYKIVNFADLPVRVDSFVDEQSRSFGNVVFVLTEFQLVDQETAAENERGDSSHDAYKARQYRSVRHRLMSGLERRNESPREVTATQPRLPRPATRPHAKAVRSHRRPRGR